MPSSICKHCCKRVRWRRMPEGHMLPMELDGSGVHDCGHLRRSVLSVPFGHAAHGLSHARSTKPTKCWWCRGPVYFHTNGFGDCVLFDELGWPWPIHSCWEKHVRRRPRSYSRSKVLRELSSVGFKFSRYAPFREVVSGAEPGERTRMRGTVIENHYEKREPKVVWYELPRSQGEQECSWVDIADARERVFRFTFPAGEASWFPVGQDVKVRGVWWEDPESSELLLIATSYRMEKALRSRGHPLRAWRLSSRVATRSDRSNFSRSVPSERREPVAHASLPGLALLDPRIDDRPNLRALAMGMDRIQDRSLEAWGRKMVGLLDGLAGRPLTDQRRSDQRSTLIRRMHTICVEREAGRPLLDEFFRYARSLLGLYRKPTQGRAARSNDSMHASKKRKRRLSRAERYRGKEIFGLLVEALGAIEQERSIEYSERFIGVGVVVAVGRLQSAHGTLADSVLVDRAFLGKVHWDSRWQVDSSSVAFRRFTYEAEHFALYIDRGVNMMFLLRTGRFYPYG